MKKTLFKSLLLGFAALTALNASAELQFEIDDFEVVPGQTSWTFAKVYVTHEKAFSAIELHFSLIDGITFNAAKPQGADLNDWPTDEFGESQVALQSNTDNAVNEFKVVVNNGAENESGVVGYWPAGKTCICRIAIKADADFTGAKLHLNYAKTDYSDPEAPSLVGIDEASNVDVCNITVPGAAGTPLKEIVENGVDGTEYTVKEDLAIVAKSDKGGYLFVSDGKVNDDDEVNWMKIKATNEVYEAMKGWESIKGGTLIGVLSEANCNQTLTVTKAAEEGGVVTASAVAWNLGSTTTKFAPKVNEVILLTGYWFNDEGEEGTFRGYSGRTGGRGQSATANFGWCDTNVDMQNGVLYKDIQSVAQLKAPWGDATTGAPAKVGANDDLSFQNYVVYPLAISDSQVITGVDNLNASKDVVSVQYVNAAGMVSTTPFKGVNMVVTRYADGSQVTTKVVK